MDLYEKSQQVLELPAVLKLLSEEAVSDGAKESAAKLAPSDDYATVERRLKETTDAQGMMVLNGSPSFTGVKDVSGA